MKIARARVLSIDPVAAGLAYVVLEGSERLVDWGVAYVPSQAKHMYLDRLIQLLEEYTPDLLVIENYETRHGPRNTRANAVLHRIKVYAEASAIPLRTVSRADVRQAFGKRANKHEIAVALSRFFPQLEPRLPRVRKPWMPEDQRMSIFDAASFALTVLRAPEAWEEIVA